MGGPPGARRRGVARGRGIADQHLLDGIEVAKLIEHLGGGHLPRAPHQEGPGERPHVQQVMILEDEVRDVLSALHEAEQEEVHGVKEVQMSLQEHGIVGAAAEKWRARPERRVPERQNPAFELVVEIRLDRRAEVAAQVKPRRREWRHDRPQLEGRQPGETRDRQGFTHPGTVPAIVIVPCSPDRPR
jgi:hypothetical protein